MWEIMVGREGEKNFWLIISVKLSPSREGRKKRKKIFGFEKYCVQYARVSYRN